MSKIEVDTIEPQSGTSLTLGASGDTITIPSGATLTNSGTATGFGKVLQVVTATYSTQATTSSTTFADSGLTASITPSSASNKVLVLVSNGIGTNNAAGVVHTTIDRAGTNLGNGTNGMLASYSPAGAVYSNGSISILDSPNTTSSTTYKYQFRIGNASYIAYAQFSAIKATINLIEIEG